MLHPAPASGQEEGQPLSPHLWYRRKPSDCPRRHTVTPEHVTKPNIFWKPRTWSLHRACRVLSSCPTQLQEQLDCSSPYGHEAPLSLEHASRDQDTDSQMRSQCSSSAPPCPYNRRAAAEARASQDRWSLLALGAASGNTAAPRLVSSQNGFSPLAPVKLNATYKILSRSS